MGLVRPTAFAGHAVPDQIHVAKAIWDFATDGGAIGAHPLGELPAGAIIIGGFVRNLITATSATDAGTGALKVEAANDLVAAIAISNGGNPWDIGNKALIPVFTAATVVATTVARQIVFTIAGEAFTAGRFVVYIFYVMPPTIEATA